MNGAEFSTLTDEAISEVIASFYVKIRRDPQLGPVFARAITDDAWPKHLAIIADFWSTVMLKTGRYRRNPFTAHQRVEGIDPELFDRWLALWRETCQELLTADAADALYSKAVVIANSLKAGLFSRPSAPPSVPSAE
jgi:hemoglobin